MTFGHYPEVSPAQTRERHGYRKICELLNREVGIVAWLATSDKPNQRYVAISNLGDATQSIHQSWQSLELGDKEYNFIDLWNYRNL
jgi:hypothetical protein